MSLSRREAGHAVGFHKARQGGSFNLVMAHGQCADEPVVQIGHVSASGRLGYLGIVQFCGVLVHVAITQSKVLEGEGNQLLEDGLLAGAGPHGVAAHRVQPQHRTNPVVFAHENGHRSQYVFQYWLVML